MKSLYSSALFIVSLFFIADSVQAQVLNVERVRAEADTTGWTGEIGADFALNKYNDRVIKVGNQANMAYFSHRHAYMLLSSIDLVNVDGNSLVSNGYVHLRSTLLRKESFSPELFVQYQYNNNLGLRNRALAGGGVQYTFLARPNIRGHISTGLMFEHEEWGVDNNTSVENNLIKSTSNLSIRGRINPQTSVTIIGYYQARPDKFFKPRATSENQLNINISQNLIFRVNFTLMYDFDPVVDVPNLTYELKNGIVLSF
jgi:hypothetical protein